MSWPIYLLCLCIVYGIPAYHMGIYTCSSVAAWLALIDEFFCKGMSDQLTLDQQQRVIDFLLSWINSIIHFTENMVDLEFLKEYLLYLQCVRYYEPNCHITAMNALMAHYGFLVLPNVYYVDEYFLGIMRKQSYAVKMNCVIHTWKYMSPPHKNIRATFLQYVCPVLYTALVKTSIRPFQAVFPSDLRSCIPLFVTHLMDYHNCSFGFLQSHEKTLFQQNVTQLVFAYAIINARRTWNKLLQWIRKILQRCTPNSTEIFNTCKLLLHDWFHECRDNSLENSSIGEWHEWNRMCLQLSCGVHNSIGLIALLNEMPETTIWVGLSYFA